MNENDTEMTEMVARLNGRIVFENYVESNSRECPERYFENWLTQITKKLSEGEQRIVWKVFIQSLIHWRLK